MDVHARRVLERDVVTAIPALLEHIEGRSLIVQAGGNVGLFPLALAQHFRSVITAEPDETNYACLKRNLKTHDTEGRITALEAAFGEREGECQPTEVEPMNCGAHRVEFGKGQVPVWSLDDLLLDELKVTALDAIYLDIEGAELLALRGAVRCIRKFSPVIALEDKGHHRAFGIPDGALQKWLTAEGYSQIDKIGQDKIFKRN